MPAQPTLVGAMQDNARQSVGEASRIMVDTHQGARGRTRPWQGPARRVSWWTASRTLSCSWYGGYLANSSEEWRVAECGISPHKPLFSMQVNTGGSAGSGCLPVNGRWQGGQAGHGPLSGYAQLVQAEYPW